MRVTGSKLGIAALVATGSVAAAPVLGSISGVDVGDYLLKLGPLGVLVWLTYAFLETLKVERQAARDERKEFLDFLREEREGRGEVLDDLREGLGRNTRAVHSLTLALTSSGVRVVPEESGTVEAPGSPE